MEDQHYKFQKMGEIVGLTVSINRMDRSPNNYLEPLLYNQSLLIRLHCRFHLIETVKPYLIFLDIFGQNNITIALKNEHILTITQFFYSIKKYCSNDVQENDKTNYIIDKENRLNSSKYKIMLLLLLT